MNSFIPKSELVTEIEKIDNQIFFLDEDEDDDYIANLQAQLANLKASMENKIKYCLRLYAYTIAAQNAKGEALNRVNRAFNARTNKLKSLHEFIFDQMRYAKIAKVDGDFCSVVADDSVIESHAIPNCTNDEQQVKELLEIYAENEYNLAIATEIAKSAIDHKKMIEAKKDELKAQLVELMGKAGLKKVDGGLCSASYSPGRDSIIVDNDAVLPEDCYKIIPETKKPVVAEIKRHLDNGETIDGVNVVKTPFVTIR